MTIQPLGQRMTSAYQVLRGNRAANQQRANRARMKAGLAAERPTYQAAPILPSIQLRQSMGQRTNKRTRSLLAMLTEARDFNAYVAKAVDNFITLANPGYELQV